MQRLTPKNSYILTGLQYDEILALSGIFGICTLENLLDKNYTQHILVTFKPYGQSINIELETAHLKELNLNIYLKDLFIENISIKAQKEGGGLSFKLLEAQIHAANNTPFYKFKRIILNAWGGLEVDPTQESTGFIVWGKYGYLMCDPDDIEKFLKKMLEHGLPYEKLFDLLHAKEIDGVNLWKEIGEFWMAEFDLSSESLSMQLFNTVKVSKDAQKKLNG